MAKIIQENGAWVLRSDWHIDDVIEQAENMGFDISEDDALEIMNSIAHSFDANLGINWDVIDSAIDQYMKG